MFFTVSFVVVAAYAVAITILHFRNPYPLIQVPDNGHRLFSVPSDKHDLTVEALSDVGLRPFGTFTAGGIRQTLMEDGMTVIASGDIHGGGISLIDKHPKWAARRLSGWFNSHGVDTKTVTPPDLGGKLVIVTLPPEFGLSGVAFHVPGPKMPWPQWEK